MADPFACTLPAAKSLHDRIVDYVWDKPVDLGTIARHFQMTPSVMQCALMDLEWAGRLRVGRYHLWEAVR